MTQQNTRSSGAAQSGGASVPASEQVEEAAGQVQDLAWQAVEQAQQTVGKVVEEAKAQTSTQLSGQKERAAESLGTMAQAIRQTGQGLREHEQGAAGGYADAAAGQVERLATYLRERDVAELLEDVEDLARRQPGVFLGAAVALGFLGTRFLMSSGRRAARRDGAPAGPAGAPEGSVLPAYRPPAAYRPQTPLSAADRPGAARPDARYAPATATRGLPAAMGPASAETA